MKLKQLAFLLPFVAVTANAEDIVISTDNNALVYNVADNGRVYQKYFGKKLKNASDYASMPNGQEIYITSGMEDYYEPALHIVHADGNPWTLLTYTGIRLRLLRMVLNRQSFPFPTRNIPTMWMYISSYIRNMIS